MPGLTPIGGAPIGGSGSAAEDAVLVQQQAAEISIRFKNGMPLLVGGQTIAGSQTCCCENPRPPVCHCPDFCSYFIEVVSPSDLAVKSPPTSCDNSGDPINRALVEGWRFSDELGQGYELYEDSLVDNLSSSDARNIFNAGLGASVRHFGNWRREFFNPGQQYQYAGFRVEASATVLCNFYQGAGEAYTPTLEVLFVAIFTERGFSDEKSGTDTARFKSYYSSYRAYFTLPVDCIDNRSRLCVLPAYSLPGDRFNYIKTPLDIVVQKDKATIAGVEYPLTVYLSAPGQPELSRAPLVDEVVDAFSATFRISSRSSCATVPADCDVPIDEGNTRVFWGGETPEFVLGTPETSVTTDPVTNDLLHYEHLAGGSGTAVYPYKFFFERTDNPPENLLEQQYVDLYCESDNNVNPPVTAWYVVHETFKYCGGFTWDKWAGTIDTYGAPEDCGNISAGDPVPIGEPTMERIGGYPLYSAGGCGDPAPRIRFEFQAPCSG